MLAIWSEWGAHAAGDDRVARSLGLFAPGPADFHVAGEWAYAFLAAPRAKPRRGWSPSVSASGLRTLFNGYFDNRAEIAAACGLDPAAAGDALVYAAAVEKWGDQADVHCIGDYCSAVVDPSARRVRLARSPYAAPPLYYHRTAERIVAASVPRALFAAGIPARLNRTRLIHNLLYHADDATAGWYHDVAMVPLGWVVVAEPGLERRVQFYDPAKFAAQGPPQANAAARAMALLEEVAGKFIATLRKPGILLSGGLDSPLAALATLRALSPEARLASFTFVPPSDWDGVTGVGRMGDEAALVREFAALHPQIEPHFFANDGIGFDYKAEELMLAMGIAPQGMANFFMFHALHAAARDAGVDGLINADLGNFSYSNNALWTWRAYFRRGQWRQLGRNLRAPGIDWRSPARRFAAYVAMPMVPLRMRARLRRMVKGPQPDYLRQVSALHPALYASPEARDESGALVGGFGELVPRTRHEAIERYCGGFAEVMGDVSQGFEQVYGVRRRDLAAYRPLIEYCLSLGPEEFLYDGTDRRLARRMGAGQVPDSIRLNTLYGDHAAGWHARLAGQRTSVIAELTRYRGNPELASLLDLDRLIAALEDWPDRTPTEIEAFGPKWAAAARAIWTGRFVNFVDGRNDL